MQYPWGMNKQEFFVAICCFICSFMITFNSTMISAVLSQFQESWGVDYSYALWFKQDIAIGMIIFSLIGIALTDKFGKKWAVIVGLVVVMVSAILCMFTRFFQGIMVFRVITGLGITLISVSNLSILTDITKKEHLTETIAVLTSVSCIGAIIAPALGLMWTETFGVTTIYLMLIPLCIVCLFLYKKVGNTIVKPDLKINIPLHVLYMAGMFLILLVLFNPQVPYRRLLATIGVILFIGFILVNHYSKDKIFNARVFKIRPFAIGLFVGVMFNFMSYAIDDTITGYLQIVDKEVVILGAVVTLVAIASFLSGLKPFIQAIFSPIVAKWNNKHPNIDFTVVGFAIMAIPVLMMFIILATLNVMTLTIASIMAFIVLAIGCTLFTPSNKKMMMGSVSSEDRNFASSMTMIVSPVSKVFGMICLVNLLHGNTTAKTYSESGLVLASIIAVVFILGMILILGRRAVKKRTV